MSETDKQWIVAAVDGSGQSKEALAWAVKQGQLTGATVEAVAVWSVPVVTSPGAMALSAEDFNLEPYTREMLDNTVAEVVGRDSDVVQSVEQGSAAAVLIERSNKVDLLVIGSRGHGEFAGMLLGSVSQHLVTHSHCPVLVVRPRD